MPILFRVIFFTIHVFHILQLFCNFLTEWCAVNLVRVYFLRMIHQLNVNYVRYTRHLLLLLLCIILSINASA